MTALGVVAAVVVVAVAARGSTPIGDAGARRPSDTLLDILLSLYVAALVAGALLYFYVLVLGRKALARSGAWHVGKWAGVRNWIGVFVLTGAALLLARSLAEREFAPAITIPEAPAGEFVVTKPERASREHEFAWVPVLITFGLIALAAVGLWWSERARQLARRRPTRPHFADAVAEAVDESLADLRAEPDPRRAVIAAYARLEHVLAAHDLPRRPAEAPLEYLGRMLAEVSVSDRAARALTELFERAKFSQHAVGAEMKEQAIAALVTVRDDLLAARALAEEARQAALAERPGWAARP